jgi:hypothetical protein
VSPDEQYGALCVVLALLILVGAGCAAALAFF